MRGVFASPSRMTEKVRNKFKPLPLNTVELQKRCARFLKIGSEEAMKICESLSPKGYISSPRTETALFPAGPDFTSLIQTQCSNPWSDYATRLLNENGFAPPRSGKGDDHAHPPIHPTKALDREGASRLGKDINPNKALAIYEYISRHFLACCSKDAVVAETGEGRCGV